MLIRNNLEAILEKRNRSLYWLQQQTGISYPTLHKIKLNQTDGIKYSVLESICTALECDVGEFLEFTKDDK